MVRLARLPLADLYRRMAVTRDRAERARLRRDDPGPAAREAIDEYSRRNRWYETLSDRLAWLRWEWHLRVKALEARSAPAGAPARLPAPHQHPAPAAPPWAVVRALTHPVVFDPTVAGAVYGSGTLETTPNANARRLAVARAQRQHVRQRQRALHQALHQVLLYPELQG